MDRKSRYQLNLISISMDNSLSHPLSISINVYILVRKGRGMTLMTLRICFPGMQVIQQGYVGTPPAYTPVRQGFEKRREKKNKQKPPRPGFSTSCFFDGDEQIWPMLF